MNDETALRLAADALRDAPGPARDIYLARHDDGKPIDEIARERGLGVWQVRRAILEASTCIAIRAWAEGNIPGEPFVSPIDADVANAMDLHTTSMEPLDFLDLRTVARWSEFADEGGVRKDRRAEIASLHRAARKSVFGQGKPAPRRHR